MTTRRIEQLYVHYALGIILAVLTCWIGSALSQRAERWLFTAIMFAVGAGFVWFPLAAGHSVGTMNEGIAGGAFVLLTALSLRWPLLLPLAFALHGTWDAGYLSGAVESHKPLWLVQLCVPFDAFVAMYLFVRWYNRRPSES